MNTRNVRCAEKVNIFIWHLMLCHLHISNLRNNNSNLYFKSIHSFLSHQRIWKEVYWSLCLYKRWFYTVFQSILAINTIDKHDSTKHSKMFMFWYVKLLKKYDRNCVRTTHLYNARGFTYNTHKHRTVSKLLTDIRIGNIYPIPQTIIPSNKFEIH